MRLCICAVGFHVGGDGLYFEIDQRDLIAKFTSGVLDLFSQDIMALQHQIKFPSNIFQKNFKLVLFRDKPPKKGGTAPDFPQNAKSQDLTPKIPIIAERKPLSGLDLSRAYRLVLICPAPETISSDSQSDGFADSRRRTSCQVR